MISPGQEGVQPTGPAGRLGLRVAGCEFNRSPPLSGAVLCDLTAVSMAHRWLLAALAATLICHVVAMPMPADGAEVRWRRGCTGCSSSVTLLLHGSAGGYGHGQHAWAPCSRQN
jgi:hypothetical protein